MPATCIIRLSGGGGHCPYRGVSSRQVATSARVPAVEIERGGERETSMARDGMRNIFSSCCLLVTPGDVDGIFKIIGCVNALSFRIDDLC